MLTSEPAGSALEASVALVVVATRGRPGETERLIELLAKQRVLPDLVAVVGTKAGDFPAVAKEPPYAIRFIVSDRCGLTSQRNRGLQEIQALGLLDAPNSFVAFFDDDFRPAESWLSVASEAFQADASLVGLTGQVLADGIIGDAISETEAAAILTGDAPSRRHWSSGVINRPVESLYGCNMAVTGAVAATCRFDEALPLYGWQEDCDFTGQARRFGNTRIIAACLGVHLGVKSARSGGVRLGYSQVANPIRICKRRNMSRLRMIRFVGRALAANLLKTLAGRTSVDYRGRMKGNILALVDLIRGRCLPGRILDLPG